MNIITVTGANFDSEVKKSEKTVLLDFWAPWCGPCRQLGPIVEEVAAEAAEGVAVGKVNVDEEPDLAMSFGVMSIPTLVVFKNGKAVQTAVGVRPKQAILAMLG